MAGLLLSSEDRAHFLMVMRRQTDSAVHRRANVLLLLDDGWSAARIAAALYLDARTVAEHRALYDQRGRAGVESLSYTGRVSRLSADQRSALSDWIAAEVTQTAQAVCDWVRDRFGVTYAAHAMARLNARDNRSRGLRAWLERPGGRIRLVDLPSCALNLNLMILRQAQDEGFRHFMKRKVLFDRAYATFAPFKQAFDDFVQSLNDHQTALESLITDRFHLIGRADAGIPSA